MVFGGLKEEMVFSYADGQLDRSRLKYKNNYLVDCRELLSRFR